MKSVSNFIKKKNVIFDFFIKNIFCNRYVVFIISLIIMLSYCYLSFYYPLQRFIHNLVPKLSYFILSIYFLNLRFSKFSFSILLYTVIALIACILGINTSPADFLPYLPVFSFALYIELAIRNNCEKSVKSLAIVMFLLIMINFITILIYPDGMFYNGTFYTNWFLLYDNGHIFLFLPTLALLYIASNYKGYFFKVLTLLAVFMITYSVYYCFSANSVFAYTPLLVYWIFENKLSKLKIFNVGTYLFSYLFVDFTIVKLRLQNLFAWLLNSLDKGVTLNNRTQLWDMVSQKIAEAPLIGHGFEGDLVFAKAFGSKTYTHAHNTFLDILYKGGFLLLSSFLLIICLVLYELSKVKHKTSKFIAFMLCCMFFMMNFEAREERIGLYIVLVLGYNIKYIVESINRNNCG